MGVIWVAEASTIKDKPQRFSVFICMKCANVRVLGAGAQTTFCPEITHNNDTSMTAMTKLAVIELEDA